MKLLEKEELKGIDSTSKTIEKWDEFFKKALVNLGYRDELIKNMYPYKRGIPMITGDRLPVDPSTGRRFFKLSDADKLAGLLSTATDIWGANSVFEKAPKRQKILMFSIWENREIFDLFFSDLEEKDKYHEKVLENSIDRIENYSEYFSKLCESEELSYLWKYFIDRCDIYQSFVAVHGCYINSSDSAREGYLDERTKTRLFIDNIDPEGKRASAAYYIFYKPFQNSFGELKVNRVRDILIRCGDHHFSDSNIENRLGKFSEVYLQDYMCVSLNPIDKFMCSTKQAFGSCMSIAKQNDTHGTSSGHAFGLPTTFDTDSVFLIFMTPGKHKNMYWENSEWEKPGEERDKEKAYKYLKMTCRCLTYQGKLGASAHSIIDKINELIIDSGTLNKTDNKRLSDIVNRIQADKERLFIGRQYSAGGEDYIWQGFASVMLARAGVRTSLAYADAVSDLKDFCKERDFILAPGWSSLNDYARKVHYHTWLYVGEMVARPPVSIDRYGYLRGIYYDNLRLNLSNQASAHGSYGSSRIQWFKNPDHKMLGYDDSLTQEGCNPIITVGSSREGSCSIVGYSCKSGLDMFKVLTGEQDYSYYNSNVKICSVCKKLLLAHEHGNVLRKNSNGSTDYICNSCMIEHEYTKCPSCGELYSKNDSEMHELVNVRELTHPTRYKDMEPIEVCKHELSKTVTDSRGGCSHYLCAHCGKIYEKVYYFDSLNSNYLKTEFKGLEITIGFCSSCYKKATMCDKCKKLIFMDSIKDACLLLPNRRVICPDCIDSIRMQQKKRNELKEVIESVKETDVAHDGKLPKEETLEQRLANKYTMTGKMVGKIDTLIKNVHKQISSYCKAHPEKEFPTIKESQIPPTESTNETVDPILEAIEEAPVLPY